MSEQTTFTLTIERGIRSDGTYRCASATGTNYDEVRKEARMNFDLAADQSKPSGVDDIARRIATSAITDFLKAADCNYWSQSDLMEKAIIDAVSLLARRAEAAERERDDLKKVVEMMPMCRDGVRIAPGMIVYHDDTFGIAPGMVGNRAPIQLADGSHAIACECYSTREAALAAASVPAAAKEGTNG